MPINDDNLPDESLKNEDMEVVDIEADGSCDESDEDEGENSNSRVYIPNEEQDKNVELECDESAYMCYHVLNTKAPCLSFDIVKDGLGDDRADKYPLAMTIIGGTQIDKAHCNNLLVLKLYNLNKTKPNDTDDDESEADDADNENAESDPKLHCASIHHPGSVNRTKVTYLNNKTIAASWSELGKVFIWDLSEPVRAVHNSEVQLSRFENQNALFTFAGHLTEGYAMDWSPVVPGMLATGDCRNNILLWKPVEAGSWHVDQRPYTAHTASVEDIQWSPNEYNVMASCSVDKTIRIWDIRAAPNKACMLTKENAHDDDVNVISWNKHDPFILSGGDDGKIRVWDLRKFPQGDPICTFKHHTAPITSVEWHPVDRSVFAASGADDQLTQWDLAVERDDSDNSELSPEILALPPQLLFIHQGQKEIKELHWHAQMPGVLVSTSLTGFNIIRTLSV